ncbi:MAG: ABC transporter ATP-binding protein/permease [Oscillospiraceae bacterium]|nr:ABC transporter ATP-binding protein/permease [Oscillospiraceae bacterium]
MKYEYEDEVKVKGLSLGIWKRLLPYVGKMKKYFIYALIIIIVWTALHSAFPLFTAYAVDNFIMLESTEGIIPFIALYFSIILIIGFLTYLWVKLLIGVEMRLGLLIRRDCFIHLQKIQLAYHNTNSVGYLIGRVMSDTERISGMISWGFTAITEASLVIIFSITYMLILSPTLALMLICIIPVAWFIAWVFQRKILVVSRKVREINSRITGAYNEGITGSKTSKTLVIEDLNSNEFAKLSDRMQRNSVRSSRLTAMMLPMVASIGSIALAIVLYRGGLMVDRGILDYGILAAFITYAVVTIEPVIWVSGVISEIVSAQVGVERVTSLLGEEITINDTPEVIEKYGDTFDPKRENWEPVLGGIKFDDVTFMYPDGDENVLENFSLDIPSGTTVAIVGETGAGKSTIVNLVCRFYEPTEGRVLIDGRDARERSQLWLHSSLGYVLQDPHLFSGTIMENIRYGKLDATDEEVIAAAKIVSADVVANRMPEGYDAEVGEGGDKLSTGEKQLVSFARAVLANPPIFVLDEATSSIDTETEHLIQNAISHMLEGRTSFIIAHRLSTISHADIILVVEDGKIVERGTHNELIAAGGHYNDLYTAMRLEETDI